MYYFGFAPDGPFEDGDVPVWDESLGRWVAQAGGGGGVSWGQALANGNVSDGTSAMITNEDVIGFIDSTDTLKASITLSDEIDLYISAADAVGSDAGNVHIIAGAAEGDGDAAGDVILHPGSATEGGILGSVIIEGPIVYFAEQQVATPTITQQTTPDDDGDGLIIQSQSADLIDKQGGNLLLLGGTGGGGELGSGGDVIVRPGGPDGSVIDLQQLDENVAIKISGDGLAGTAISVSGSGLRFWSGTPAIAPAVTGASVDPVVISLVNVLAAMGLITDSTT